MNLVIVESPAKAKTIKKYLGKDFEVLASYGHVRDLVPKEGAVDPANDFAMKYQVIEKNDRHVQAISKALKGADTLYLATDPDREGEAISWHLYELLKGRRHLKGKEVYRVVFNEITKKAIQDAVAHPRQLSMDLVNAQQARRALDYLVGFNLSPLLWKKVRRGLSAGRVQSPALRMIVEREEEIEAFVAREYWSVEADLDKLGQRFSAKLTRYGGEKIEQFSITNAAQAAQVEETLQQAAGGRLSVTQVQKKQRRRNPAAPFTTSTLQQEAALKLGFTAQRTMRTAQQLYEGIDTGTGAVGLITYMRTDSVHLADEALEELRAFINERFGTAQLPKQPRLFKTKAKNAQEAHEAIRPTSALRTPEELQGHLSRDQHRLYELIWKRTVACQMIHATINTVAADLACGADNNFRATGSTIANPGFMALYLESVDDAKKGDDDEKMLPPLEEGEQIDLRAIRPEQHFTEPPPRYSEASLVKALEEHGIGRPSTYASIISTLQDREYVQLEKKRFHPTDVGRVVNRFLTNYFTRYVDYDFTARLEDELDAVSRGEEEWVPLLRQFWGQFKERIDHTQENVKRSDVTHEALDESCPECGSPLSIRLGRHGRFVGCTNYPTCSYTRDLDGTQREQEPETVEGRNCPDCDSTLVIKRGKYGKFIGCSGYPGCRYIEPLEKPEDTGVTCPKCANGSLMKRKSRRGKIFYSCATYPRCDYATWNEPLAEPCPRCGWPILTLKTTKRRGTEKVCPQKECGFCEPVDGETP
ncbi:MAG: type I DNA topoisomerase [Candidatus Sedimenticola endophacoides]|uniref:DNA topoisomerase 1 n=2 Tax=Candidatus Sedimenticola endophacoides TaxID=2548426 RepID=A0A6N4E862_9GAMM|nr:MAG: DNA topoisomerase I [Candidatus Sedimenticola endophacoides]PUD99660.1 MAG: type I DNA topoisomerase [Candidatus Sedimenticola endophacoides]PUE03326.1 MAG: type I DNA topoisomerase [Candidatus Sedimenticola endophacoides]PUE05178.1 MAG: type I DNA topoisomerase [Candidatus Sedimenticola endophacoides]